VFWTLRTYHKRRKEYPLLFQRSEYAHLEVIRLLSPDATQVWLHTLEQKS
jgi:hypothetical protein